MGAYQVEDLAAAAQAVGSGPLAGGGGGVDPLGDAAAVRTAARELRTWARAEGRGDPPDSMRALLATLECSSALPGAGSAHEVAPLLAATLAEAAARAAASAARAAAAMAGAVTAAAAPGAELAPAALAAADLAALRTGVFWGSTLLQRLARWQGAAGAAGPPARGAAAQAARAAQLRWLPTAAAALAQLGDAAGRAGVCAAGGLPPLLARPSEQLAADKLLMEAALPLLGVAVQTRSTACDGALAGALAQHLAFVVQEVCVGRAAPGAPFSEVAALLLSPDGGGDGAHALLVRACAALLLAPAEGASLLEGSQLHMPEATGLKAVSLIAEVAVEKLQQAAAGCGGVDRSSSRVSSKGGRPDAAAAASRDEAASTAVVRVLVAIAEATPRIGLAPMLLRVLHAPLLGHPKAAMRKALADLAAAAMASAAAVGKRAAEPEALTLLACMAENDRDAVVRAKALGLLAAAARTVAAAHAAAQAAPGSDTIGAAAAESVHAGLLSRLLDSSKSVRRAAVDALAGLVDAGAAAGDAGRAWAAGLLRAAIGPLMALIDAPPASAAHDPEARDGVTSLLRRLPGLVGFESALSLLLACESEAGCCLLLDALLSTGGQSQAAAADGPATAAAAAPFDAWARALQEVSPTAVQQLAGLCARHAAAAAGAASAAARGLEGMRRRAFGALAAELGAMLALQEAAPAAPLLVPLAAARRMAAAARVAHVMGGVKGAGGDAGGEAGILADVLGVLLPMCGHATSAEEEAAAAALAASSDGAAPEPGSPAADAVRWTLEACSRCSIDGGALPSPVARALRPSLLAQLPALVARGPLRCVDLALGLLCSCCGAQPLQRLLGNLEARALTAAPGPAADAAEAAFCAQLAASRRAEGCADGGGGGASAAAAAAAAGGEGAGSYLEADAQQRADTAAAARFVESLLAEDAAPASRVPLLAALVGGADAPDFVQVLSLAALEQLLLLSDALAEAHAPAAVLAPLADAAAPPALRRRAVRAAGAIAAKWPRHAPAMLAALEALLLSELAPRRAAAAAGPQHGPASDPAEGAPAASADGGRRPGAAAPSLAEAAAAAYYEAVLADSLVLSSSAYAAVSACLLAGGASAAPYPAAASATRGSSRDGTGAAVARTAERLVRCLLAAAPPHIQRRIVLGLLAHAPGGEAPQLARGALAKLLPEQLRGGDELALGLVQAVAGARGDGAAAVGASCEASTAGVAEGSAGAEAGAGADGAAAEACAVLLEVGCGAAGARPLAALLAHLQARPEAVALLSPAAVTSLRAWAARAKPAASRAAGAAPAAAGAGGGAPQELQARLLQLLAFEGGGGGGAGRRRGAAAQAAAAGSKRKQPGGSGQLGGRQSGLEAAGEERLDDYERALQLHLGRTGGGAGVLQTPAALGASPQAPPPPPPPAEEASRRTRAARGSKR
ncbi:hypothetical protein Rsub_01621 [Raphidocelis subcapitata]|uniref:Uncharacterized protein n=1 Tax=Raphidocelis subcapitata TaxID=307507 RepID=A0A2V0NQ63_9CHLO|nr:hypothetical protein Rsub_01621 [Raphidocelis subcapitata]|eukprot:GBF88722.1 hypothetical protein Rsub_01621 [Raphidocelis subcapitata]